MKEIEISSMDQLLRELNSLPNRFVYRGHADADWILESSLERVIGNRWAAGTAAKFEDRSLDLFKSKFHLYDHENICPESKLSWLSIMQHYGVPTRLLDFTESPYVALYFALEAYDPHSKRDFSIFALDYTALMQGSIDYISGNDPSFRETRQSVHKNQDAVFDQFVDRGAHAVAWIAEPQQFNKRLDRQAGSFLLSGDPGIRIQEVLALPIYQSVAFSKYRLPGKFYESIYALLRKMNLTSKSLYGDLQGLARSVKMELQVYST